MGRSVHLNGRVYDPLIGKFVSGDPHITDPLNGQNYNRYSYVLNNPTNDIDPTGFDAAVAVQPTTTMAEVSKLLDDGATHVTSSQDGVTTSFTKNSSDGTITAVSTLGSSNGGAMVSQLAPVSVMAKGTQASSIVQQAGSRFEESSTWGIIKNWASTGWDAMKRGPTEQDFQGIPDLGPMIGGAGHIGNAFGKVAEEAPALSNVSLGSASFVAKNEIGQLYSPNVVLTGKSIIFNDFAVGTARGFMGLGEKGAAELLGPMRQLVNFSQKNGASSITLTGKYVTEEGAALGKGKIGQAFSFTFNASDAGLKDLFRQLR